QAAARAQDRIDSLSRARAALTLMAADLRAGLLRAREGDLAAFVDADGRPALVFYTGRSPAAGGRAAALVRYQFDEENLELKRFAAAVDWDGTSAPISFGNTQALAQAASLSNPTSLAQGVAGVAVTFIHADGLRRAAYRLADGTRAKLAVVTLVV